MNMYMTVERTGVILNELKQYIRSSRTEIDSLKILEGNYRYEEMEKLDNDLWKPFAGDARWGGKDRHYWFSLIFTVPENLDGRTIALEVVTGRENGWDALNPQFLAYVNGKPVQGLDVNHREIILSQRPAKGEKYLIYLHAYSGMADNTANLECHVSSVEKEVEKLYYDIKVPYDVAKLLDSEDKRRIDTLKCLNDTINLLDLRKPFSEEFKKSVARADEYLEREFYAGYCGKENITALCVGHTHIDVAWLWTLAQTREKAARSFATVLALMKQYPEYRFMSSQPQLYEFVKEDYPELYNEIKDRAAEGRWEPEGAMWLEADCNLASGEALVRQLLLGTRYFKKEFGVKTEILWLPDVFGYSAALPQILKKSGINYFMTTKISWNEYNKIPYDTFKWSGLDGTEILTYFITTQDYNANGHITTYNGNLTPTQVMGAWRRYQQKEMHDEVMISYGFGDGGGGPTREMLENARRMEKGIPGCPKVKQGKALDFFKRLDASAAKYDKLPEWVGELYLEFHRGTYTSIARNKKFNRKSEYMYQAAEWISVCESILGTSPGYPAEMLNNGWKTILLNQFHDILPGSSIKEVYEDSRKQYTEILRSGQVLMDNAMSGIAGRINLNVPSVVVFNQLGFKRNDIVEFDLPESWENIRVLDEKGHELPVQLTGEGKVVFYASDVPSMGYKSFEIQKSGDGNREELENRFGNELENKFYRIRFDGNMNISSVFDKLNNREVLKPGERANVLQAFEDKPVNFDAWDINIYYQEKMWEINDVQSVEVVESGGVRTTVRINRKFCDSLISQYISVYSGLPRIDFRTVIDWKETQVLLKAAFPVDIHSDKAVYDIQFGNVERPTHWNTSWDQARFEVCAHKWADLSEDDYGVSLLNDCKYGYDIKDGVMRLTLLKSAKYPNEDADREKHEFTYSLYPHSGGFREAGTVQAAYALNCPMYAKAEDRHAGKLPREFMLAEAGKENVIMETVKKAEDSDNVIIRLYECYNRRSRVKPAFGGTVSDVWECDLMENNIRKIENGKNSFEFEIRPFEIKTFKLGITYGTNDQ